VAEAFRVKARPPLAVLQLALNPWAVMQVASKQTGWTTVNTPKLAVNKKLMRCSQVVSKLPGTCSPLRNNITDPIHMQVAMRVLIQVGTQRLPELPLQRLELRSVLQRVLQLELMPLANHVPVQKLSRSAARHISNVDLPGTTRCMAPLVQRSSQ
jgi:hypothetical protein